MDQKESRSFKKRRAVPYVLVAIAAAAAAFFAIRSQSLEQQLEETTVKQTQLEQRQIGYQELIQIDSSLIDGEYGAALRAYNEELQNESGQDSVRLALRIALAKQLSRYRSDYRSQEELDEMRKADSLEMNQKASPREIRDYDAVSFELEKAKVQLGRMRQQLKEKSFGEYLSFESEKGNQMHYVGQVKQGKANGYGVALLDTGSRYQGEWKNNKRHGEGTFYWPDGEYYEGSYVNDKRKGGGTYHWPNGEKYVGQWEADKRNGRGTFYGEDGKVVTQGVWKDDKLVEEDEKS
ncbi:MAG: hypothetical protein WA913_13850 [Pricia sp.]